MRRTRDANLKELANHWMNGPLPGQLMADLADIAENEEYSAEKRAHQIVWQALRYGMGDTHTGVAGK